MKRGFQLKRDADQWERSFLEDNEKKQKSPGMSVRTLSEDYLKHLKATRKGISYQSSESRHRLWIIPFFSDELKDKPIGQIDAADIKDWTDWLRTQKTARDKPLSDRYINTLFVELSTMFNYAATFHNLPKNPCKGLGKRLGVERKDRDMCFWTDEEFHKFIDTFEKSDPLYTVYMVLFWTGMRIGELMALTVQDIDLDSGSIRINKTLSFVNGDYVVTTPKSEKSKRKVFISETIVTLLREYISRIYKPLPTDRVFPMSARHYRKYLAIHADLAGVPQIRIHDLRHSHASLLIKMGVSPVLIADRLGHESASTTLKVYAHLYTNEQYELVSKMESRINNRIIVESETPEVS